MRQNNQTVVYKSRFKLCKNYIYKYIWRFTSPSYLKIVSLYRNRRINMSRHNVTCKMIKKNLKNDNDKSI